jgi:hypothetical protein
MAKALLYPTKIPRNALTGKARAKIYPTPAQLNDTAWASHTGEFEELRNFGMCRPRSARRDCKEGSGIKPYRP